MANNSQLFEHMQRYIREVMAQRLREEGFASYKGEDIHWYRLVNNEMVQCIYFVTRDTHLHSFVDIDYGCHRLFIPPVFQKSPYFYTMPCAEQMDNRVPELVPGSTVRGFHSLMICGACNRPYRIPDVLIMCPTGKNYGLDVLELVFPFLNQVVTPRACYEMHKSRRQGEIEEGDTYTMSPYFVDEVLFWADEELYEYCRGYLLEQISMRDHVLKSGGRAGKAEQLEWEQCAVLDAVLRDGTRREDLKTLNNRYMKIRQLLRKNCGIL